MKMNIQKSIIKFFVFDKQFFVFGLITFPFLVVLGTLSHEIGHVFVAKLLGFDTNLHYGSMHWFVDGINGETLKEAICKVDKVTNNYPAYYMINCAHPSHFISALEDNASWKSRIRGIRANASCKSHQELDESTELDVGNANELAQWHSQLKDLLPKLKVYGGCCGTDLRHIEQICKSTIAKSKVEQLLVS